MGLWQRLFGAPTLATIDRPTRLKITGKISSENDAVGLMTGMRGAVVELQFSARYRKRGYDRYGNQVETDEEAFEVLGTFLAGGPVRVTCEGGELVLPTKGMSIRFAGDDHGVPIDRPVPPELGKVLGTAAAIGRMLYYRELALSHGDKVRIDAMIAPSTEVDPDGYRGTTIRGWVARPDLSPTRIEDLSLDDI